MSDASSGMSKWYIARILVVALGITALQFVVGGALYCWLYGIPSLGTITTVWVPEYATAEYWKGNVVYSVRRTNAGPVLSPTVVKSYDPESGNVGTIEFDFRDRIIGMVAEGEVLRIVSTSSIATYDGEKLTEHDVKRVLVRPTRPFMYNKQLAVIDRRSGEPYKLLLMQDDDWAEEGNVAIPFHFAVERVDDEDRLVRPASTAVSKVGTVFSSIEILTHGQQSHVFASNGTHVLYRPGIQLEPASALMPVNNENQVDLSRLTDWEIVCPVTSTGLLTGKQVWRAGLSDGHPVLTTVGGGSAKNPFQSMQIICFGRQDGKWQALGEASSMGVAELVSVTNGSTTFVAPYSLIGGILRLYQIRDNALTPTGGIVKAPQPEFISAELNAIRLLQWLYWPILAIYIFAISYLIDCQGNEKYQFGATEVELASFARRGFASVIDFFIYLGTSYLIAWSFGMLSQEEVDKNVDKIFDFGPNSFMVRYLWMIMTLAASYLTILVITSWMEGRWGLTLGKWIFGIRTRRSTLRPCGFLRAMLREIFILLDTLCAFCCLPGSLSVALTRNRQRFGDRVADTIVIRKPDRSDNSTS